MKCSLCSSLVSLRVFCSQWSGHINRDSIKKPFLPNRQTTCLSRARSKWKVMQWSCSYCSTHKNVPLAPRSHFGGLKIWIFMDYCFFVFFWIWCNRLQMVCLVLMNLQFQFSNRSSSTDIKVQVHSGNELIHFFFRRPVSLIIRGIELWDFSLQSLNWSWIGDVQSDSNWV